MDMVISQKKSQNGYILPWAFQKHIHLFFWVIYKKCRSYSFLIQDVFLLAFVINFLFLFRMHLHLYKHTYTYIYTYMYIFIKMLVFLFLYYVCLYVFKQHKCLPLPPLSNRPLRPPTHGLFLHRGVRWTREVYVYLYTPYHACFVHSYCSGCCLPIRDSRRWTSAIRLSTRRGPAASA